MRIRTTEKNAVKWAAMVVVATLIGVGLVKIFDAPVWAGVMFGYLGFLIVKDE